jgi:hypothetical protein
MHAIFDSYEDFRQCGALKIEVRVTFTGYWRKYQLICSGNLLYLLT